jgi:hypothetical protein
MCSARSILLSRRRPRRSYRNQSGGGPPRRRSLPLPRRLLLLRRRRPPDRRRPRLGSSCTAERTTLNGSSFSGQANRLRPLPEMQRPPRGRRRLPSPGLSRKIVRPCFMVLCRGQFCRKRTRERERERERETERARVRKSGRQREGKRERVRALEPRRGRWREVSRPPRGDGDLHLLGAQVRAHPGPSRPGSVARRQCRACGDRQKGKATVSERM